MPQTTTKRKKASKGEWIFAIILGAVFLIWFFSTRDYRTEAEKEQDRIDEKAREYAVEAKVQAARDERFQDLYKEIEQELKLAGIPFLKAEIADSKCLWVYTKDNGKNRDGLAMTLCYTAKRHFVPCVTIVNAQQETLGRCNCDKVP